MPEFCVDNDVVAIKMGWGNFRDNLDYVIKAVLKALSASPKVITLTIDQPHLSDQAAKAIAHFLTTNKTIKRCYLPGTNIGNEGFLAIAKALESNSTLTILDLNGHNADCIGLRYLLEMLKINTTLQQIDISCVNITINFKDRNLLTEAFSKNYFLKRFCANFEFQDGQPETDNEESYEFDEIEISLHQHEKLEFICCLDSSIVAFPSELLNLILVDYYDILIPNLQQPQT